MTHEVAVHKLRSFIKELENAGLIVPSAAEDINKAINTLASPLPVMRIEDVELKHDVRYAILHENCWYFDMVYVEEIGFNGFEKSDYSDDTYPAAEVQSIIQMIDIVYALIDQEES